MKGRLFFLLLGSFLYSSLLMGQQIVRLEFFELAAKEISSTILSTTRDSAEVLVPKILKSRLEEGYLEAFWEVSSQNDTLLYRLELGQKYHWAKVDFPDSLGFEWEKKAEMMIPYSEPYSKMDEWVSSREKEGYPFAQARLTVVEMAKGKLTGQIQLDLGPFITWDSLEIKGNTRTQQRYLQRFSGIEPGTPFAQDQFETAVRKVGKSPYFTWEAPPEIQFRTRQAVPVFSLRDRRINVFDGIVGFLPNANEPGRLLVTGQVDLRLFHLGGRGREGGLQWQKLNQQSQSLDVRFKERYLFGSPLEVEVNFSLLKQDSSFVNRSFGIDVGLQISERNYFTFFHKRQSGDLVNITTEGAQLGDLVDFRWNHYGIKWAWSSLDQAESPRKGSRIHGQLSLGNKRIIENTGIPEEAYENVNQTSPQIQAEAWAEKYLYVNPRYGIWLKTAGGHLQNQNLFLNELFRLGGLKSIRGFYETFFYAKSYAYTSMEHRLYLDSNSYLMAFTDLGILSNPFSSVELDRPISFGTGINLDTGGGLFSFVVALGRSTAQPMSFSYARVHFGYLARF